MGKKITNYRDVKNNTSGKNYYGNNAHLNSSKEFKEKNGHRATMDNAQELRDMAEKRQNHWCENEFVPDCDDND